MKIMTNPEEGVSVILPVFNGAKYLREAIDSIVNQDFKNFELIIIDDGSKDDSWEIIKSYIHLDNVKAIRQDNMRLAATLNKAIGLAKYGYIARQDQDDVSLPGRLKIQYEFMNSHPDIDMVGSWAKIIEEDKLSERMLTHPVTDPEIKIFLIFDTPFVHSSVLFKKKSIINCGLYSTDPLVQPPEDYELWTRMAIACKFANIPEVLLHYREVPTSMSRDPENQFIKKIINSSDKYMQKLGFDTSKDNLSRVYHGQFMEDVESDFIGIFFLYKSVWKKIFKMPFNPFEKTASMHLKILFKKILKHKINISRSA
jgi:glycosyltransferase involved in cell wall biosynthesis